MSYYDSVTRISEVGLLWNLDRINQTPERQLELAEQALGRITRLAEDIKASMILSNDVIQVEGETYCDDCDSYVDYWDTVLVSDWVGDFRHWI